MANVTIDGHQVEVPAGTTILRAAKQAGVEIPVFCYHPGLSIPANCRMCLVEIEKNPKPQPACYTEVADGMVVHTTSQKVKDTQAAVLEFILLNHPVDCPICDQAGECVLQEHYVTWSAQPSRLEHEKTGKPKAKILGPTVVLDAERCINCTRCVRFTEEVTKTFELTQIVRGEHAEITCAEGKVLDNPYSLNVVDICPVGALTSRQFRFRRRVWFLDMRPSVCTGCGRGCSVRIDSHANQVERIVPRYNPDVNRYWMCDDGRESLRRAGSVTSGRVPGPNEQPREAPGLDGVRAVGGWLKAAHDAGTKVGFALSASLANEDVYAWARLARLTDARMYLLPRAAGRADTVLRTADADCNTTGARAILGALFGSVGGGAGWGDAEDLAREADMLDTLVVVDNGIAATPDVLGAVSAIRHTAVFTDKATALSDAALAVVPTVQLHARDCTVTNVGGWVQRVARPLKAPVTAVVPHAAAALLADLAGDVALDFTEKTRPAELFERLAGAVPAFAGLTYDEIGDLGRGLPRDGGLAPRRLRLDGTPAWEPDPVAPTAERAFQIRRGA
ncbi:MAG: 2Fe-2S iron-sulfur cluster binding domain-containing protein [Myxococcales bacterium]|nr:2Fe-2S iron-sulfur cluster binding domain-containing protein [Myxococcales bacterium]